MVTPAQTDRLLGSSDKLGKHEVIRAIAVGGVAELYLTRTVGTEGLERLACVKRILPQYTHDPGFISTFLNEARLAATLHHPNIAQVFDVGQDHGEYFFSMEYVHGEDLGRLVTASAENRVPISLDCALTVAAGLCAGLHHAHEKTASGGRLLGMVHRDVSPTNILISYDGAVKLVDFGLAAAAAAAVAPSPGGFKGKISYMSPEQVRGAAVDRRSDVFSVGTILYQLTTGRLPFIDATEPGVVQQLLHRDAAPPSTLVPGYPPPLEAIVMRALARDPDRRFSTALALQSQIEDFAHGNRLRVSPLVLARLMSTLFPARLEEWDHARAQGAFFVEQHVVRTLIESGKVPGAGGRYEPQPLPAVDDTSGALVPPPGVFVAALDVDRTVVEPQSWLPQPAGSPPGNGHPPRALRSTSSPASVPSAPSRVSYLTLPPPASPAWSKPASTPQGDASSTVPPAEPLDSAPVPPPRSSRSTLPPPDAGESSPRSSRSTSPPQGNATPPVAPSGSHAALPQANAPPSQPARSSRSTSPPQGNATPPASSSGSHAALPEAGAPPSLPLRPAHASAPPPASGDASPQVSPPVSLPQGTAPLPSPPGGGGHPASPRSSRSSQPQASVLSSSLRVPRSATQPPASVPGAPRRSSPLLESSPPAAHPPSASPSWPPDSTLPSSLPLPTDDPFQTSPLQVIQARVGYYPPSPIPSGGTLVSSATQAGRPPPAVRPVAGPYGQGGLDGYAGQNHGTPGGPGMGMRGPGMQGGFGAHQAIQPAGRTALGPRSPAAAVPTLMIRHPSRSRFPLVVLAMIGAAGAAVGVWFAVGAGGDGDAAAPAHRAVVQKAAPAAPAEAPSAAGAEPPSAPGSEPPSADTASQSASGRAGGATPTGTATRSGPDVDSAKRTVAPGSPANLVPPPGPAAVVDTTADPSKKPPAKVAPVDPRAKPVKAKPRAEPKRAPKIQPKEQPWNDDSPFMPVATPKR